MSVKPSRRKFKVDSKLREIGASTAGKQDTLISGSNIKTVNGNTLLGSGNLVITATGGYAEGATFPGSPTNGTKFYRTDLNWLCFYDGTRWLTCHEYSQPIAIQDILVPRAVSSAASTGYLALRQDFDLFLTSLTIMSLTVSPNNGSNYWEYQFRYKNSSNSATVITTINTSTHTPLVATDCSVTLNTPLNTAAIFLDFLVQGAAGSPGACYPFSTINYRLIVT